MTATRAEVCIVACAEAWRGDGEILASPIGVIPALGARLARATFSPDLLLTDGVASLVSAANNGSPPVVEGWLPYRQIFDLVWSGKRHVMMGATQIDRFGNQNIGCLGDWHRPKTQLIGVRGAPGNTINHPTSYFVPQHTPRVFVPRVDFVCGIGYDRAAAVGARFHEIRRVVTNLAVLDFRTPDNSMRIASVHPGVEVAQVVAATGFALAVADDVPQTRWPTEAELSLLRDVLDPAGAAGKELGA